MIPFVSIDRWGKIIKSKPELDSITFLNLPKRQSELILMYNSNVPYQAIDKKYIMVGIERRKETPEIARNFLKDLNGFFN
ncbi:hypothetical protein [Bartonella sp. B1099]|uniref:hypothetical protein n=1 Tax=Bartonella sp. B1099 TaxID=2911422 RepID=UPI0020C370F8|nr:hypothetical protein [Bartonella sp. B1099]